ncbi:hypothetical protein A7K93_09335 [Candidatus Methylacidiphilum fumarolicum]|nr:hypothetical protein A7K93_09335 [Candidatus Methylacidiphilum fumarolicum]TFE74184.1 hypothetical protein A7K72_04570 [Candidatus Methylacidiphilum fumarolicum]
MPWYVQGLPPIHSITIHWKFFYKFFIFIIIKKIYKNNLLNFLVLFSFERYPLQRLFLNKRR